jgi:hypothetical protein
VRRSPALVTMVIAGALLAGCGSKPLSTGQLHNQATRVCSLASRQTDRITSPAAPAGSARFLRRGIAVLTPELARLKTLRPPHDVADVYTASVEAFAKKLSYLKDAAHEMAGGEDPLTAMKFLELQLAPVVQQENGGWKALEIPACVSR